MRASATIVGPFAIPCAERKLAIVTKSVAFVTPYSQTRRAERPEKEVLDRGLVREPIGPLDPGEDVNRDRHGLEADEERDQIRRQRDGHRADRRETDDRVVLAGRDEPPRQVLRRHGDGEDREDDEHRAEERCEGVDGHEAAEVLRGRNDIEDRGERHDEASDRDHGEREGRASAVEGGVGDEHDHGDGGHDDLGIDGGDICPTHLKAATTNEGSVARRMTRSSDGSM
jgi:hypothetical protein